jgi:ubiquinone/menaquinone biosynthesis C-methylase UbiE
MSETFKIFKSILSDDKWDLFNRRRMQSILTNGLPISESWRILDAGCGEGTDTFYLSDKVDYVVGVDLQLSDSWKRRRNIDYVICDVLRLPFRDDGFDLAIAKDILHHIPRGRVKDALTEIKRVISPKGFIRVIEANRYHINSILVYKENPTHNHFSQEEFERLMGPNYFGFELLPWLYRYHISDLPWYIFVIALKLVTKVHYMFKVILSILIIKQNSKILKRHVTYFIWTYPPLKMNITQEV